ncbi:MAG: hypothetical protein AB7D38_09930 [Sulfurimonas sp.]|uniref:beta family protein n=1 Tax=Sulfurimonas sp. TaxID=2022749 RepID=UPI003D121950
MSYIPIMKYKERVDMTAYEKHDINSNDVTPMIEVFHEDKLPLNKIDGDKTFYLGILFDRNMKFQEAVDYFIDAQNIFSNMIPVINGDYNFDEKKETIKAFKKLSANFTKIAFKFNNIKSMYLHQNLENIMLMYDDILDADIFLDVDYAYKYQPSVIVDYVDNAINILHKTIDDELENFIIAGSIVKVTSAAYKSLEDNNNTPQIVENNLLQAFPMLLAKYDNIKYADYTIDEKHVFTDDETSAMSFYPMVKHTLKDGKIAVYKSNSLRDFTKYKEIASLIYHQPYYNSSHCEGCEYVSSIVKKQEAGKGTGNPTTWKLNSMIHHIRTMGELLGHS